MAITVTLIPTKAAYYAGELILVTAFDDTVPGEVPVTVNIYDANVTAIIIPGDTTEDPEGYMSLLMALPVAVPTYPDFQDPFYVAVATITDTGLSGLFNIVDLPTPTGFAVASVTGTTIALTWNAVTDADGYVIEVSTDGSDWVTHDETYAVGVTTSFVHNPPLTPGTTRYYRISARSNGAESGVSSTINGTTAAAEPSGVNVASAGIGATAISGFHIGACDGLLIP